MDASDLEASAPSSVPTTSYTPLLRPNTPNSSPPDRRKSYSWWINALSITALLLILSLVALMSYGPSAAVPSAMLADNAAGPRALSRGPSYGVSEKSTAGLLGDSLAFTWTNAMLNWQRTGYHFQPEKNWMNDPDGPLYYKGWYHLFYQYNPFSAVWGNITWGHAVSQDMIHWRNLPLAMVPSEWYDADGVWTGSATVLPDGRIAMLYTGSTTEKVQVQNLAYPADPNDPLLVEWKKSEANPVILPPPHIDVKDFRDPTTAWYVPAESEWRLAIGSKNDSDKHTGIAMVYRTKDFINYYLILGYLHSVDWTGMWECVDFYPVSTESEIGLDTSTPSGPGVKHVLKASLDDDKHDYYAIGTYSLEENEWVPDDPENDVGIGLRVDYGKYYASKTFFDPVKNRRILWGWIGETDSEQTDLQKGWASVQTIPRNVLYDRKTRSNIIQWPIEEVENLRLSSQHFEDISLSPGRLMSLDVGKATQLDIEAEFELDHIALDQTLEADVGYNCSTSDGAAERGSLGPFGLLVLADDGLSEQTAAYFYVAVQTDGGLRTFFCQDEIRSSKADDIVKRIYGSVVPVLHGERLTVRILVDHSIIESFAQGGRVTVTSRVYPTKAINSGAKLFLFNNATGVDVVAKSVKVWQMDSAPVITSGSDMLMYDFTVSHAFLLIIIGYLFWVDILLI